MADLQAEIQAAADEMVAGRTMTALLREILTGPRSPGSTGSSQKRSNTE